jgi:hypothetical protein
MHHDFCFEFSLCTAGGVDMKGWNDGTKVGSHMFVRCKTAYNEG